MLMERIDSGLDWPRGNVQLMRPRAIVVVMMARFGTLKPLARQRRPPRQKKGSRRS